uniref:Uncharacterized protein n=1 Tax=Salix viminalis TaxID=40686 RepID=A0A6N2MBE7_SALVM
MKNTLRKQQQKIDLARLITFRQPLPPPRPRSQVLRQQLHPGIADIQTRDHSCCFQASVNSISSMPSPVYQCKKAFLLNIAVNCSLTRLNISWMEVEFPMKTGEGDEIHSKLPKIRIELPREPEAAVGSIPCSAQTTSQNLEPIWLPHCPP